MLIDSLNFNGTTGTDNLLMYSELLVGGSYVYGGCNDWQAYVGGSLLVDTSRIVDGVTMYTIGELNGTASMVDCVAGADGASIVSGLIDDSLLESMSCTSSDGTLHNWTLTGSAACGTSGIGGLCVDCDDIPGTPTCGSHCGGSYSMSPCSEDCGASSTSRIRLLSIKYRPYLAAPDITIDESMLIVNRTSISIPINVSSDGIVYCALQKTASSSSVPLSVSDVIRADNKLAINENNTIFYLPINRLSAATEYNLYCVSVSKDQVRTTLDVMLNNRITVFTLCCKMITVTVLSKSVYMSQSLSNMMMFTVDAVPAVDTYINITAIGSSSSIYRGFFPNSFLLSNTSTVNEYFVSWSGSSSQDLGTFVYDITATSMATGLVSSEMELQFDRGDSFDVLDSTVEPGTPVLVGATFSEDGTYVVIVFDSPTDKHGVGSGYSFPCGSVFAFDSDTLATCAWIDDFTVHIYPGKNSLLTVGSYITVLSDVLKAACSTVTATCSTWSNVLTATVTISTPTFPIVPTVILSSPTLMGACDDWTLDLSSSLGSGGRTWTNVTFVITSTAPNVTEIQTFLDVEYQLSPPSAISHELLHVGYKYYVTATLCNFLGGCSSSNEVVINIVSFQIPTVGIVGSSTRTMLRKSLLEISGSAYTLDCSTNTGTNTGTGLKSYTDLVYSWIVDVDGADQRGIVSESRDVSKFTLGGYNLLSDTLYRIELSVLSTVSKKASSTYVEVYITRGELVARIGGGTSRSVQQGGGVLMIDASQSYDEDINPNAVVTSTSTSTSSGDSVAFDYTWSCSELSPFISSSCGVVVMSETSGNSSLIVQADNTLSTDATVFSSLITVTISDGTFRSSQV